MGLDTDTLLNVTLIPAGVVVVILLAICAFCGVRLMEKQDSNRRKTERRQKNAGEDMVQELNQNTKNENVYLEHKQALNLPNGLHNDGIEMTHYGAETAPNREKTANGMHDINMNHNGAHAVNMTNDGAAIQAYNSEMTHAAPNHAYDDTNELYRNREMHNNSNSGNNTARSNSSSTFINVQNDRHNSLTRIIGHGAAKTSSGNDSRSDSNYIDVNIQDERPLSNSSDVPNVESS